GKRSPLELLAPGVARGGVRLLCDAVAEQVRSGAADAAVFSGKRTYPALSAFGRVPVLVDVCDATSQRLKGELRAELGERGFRWRAPVTAADLASVRWVERQLRRRALHATFASDRDRDALGWPASSATVVPNGVDAS